MSSILLDIVMHEDGSYYFDNAAESLIYAVIGLVVVFVGMALLIAVLYLVGFIIKKAENARRAAAERATASAPVDENAEEIPEEVRAAIVAAVMSYYAEEKPHCDFVVKRIKKI